MAGTRYLVGIDLGTTHTVVAYTERGDTVRIFEIEQLVALGEVAARTSLPSSRYHPADSELNEADLLLPWPQRDVAGVAQAVVGSLARDLGAQVPGRLVASAKSWLSHPSVDRTAAILPWGAAEDVPKVSPLAANASYLAHVRAAWNHRFGQHPLERQEVVLTVPASFDEGARALTVEAARLAGLPAARLLEEPQAAFYDWLYRHRDELEAQLQDTRLVLVCDVGGGTTDLTLIRVQPGAHGPQLTRIGVGDHLMLGGDNMDLGLAHVAEGRIAEPGVRLSTTQMSQLIQQCRSAKERLLAPEAPLRATVTVLGAGARLIGGARSTELSRSEVDQMVVDGFFPSVGPDEHPHRVRGGIVEFGLPYVADPAVTRHVASFLARHAQVSRETLAQASAEVGRLPMPDALLLNGGVFRGQALAERLVAVLNGWRGAPLRVLNNDDPEAAVARGAVAYGLALRGTAPRIGGGSARSYFLVLEEEGQQQGICLLPRGSKEGEKARLTEQTFALSLGQPVRFHIVSTTAGTVYTPGQLVDIGSHDFVSLPPIATVIKAKGGQIDVAVQLVTALTEVGTLEIHCVSAEDDGQRWKLEFQLRAEAPARVEPGVSTELHPRFGVVVESIERVYGGRSQQVDAKAVRRLRQDLEKTLGRRDNWDTPLLREMFGTLWERAKRRRRSADHERLWFNLSGYCLRPGFGYPLDDWRVEQLWGLFEGGVQFVPEAQVWSEWWTLWRRVAGGLPQQAQVHILDDIAFYLRPPGRAKRPRGVKKQGYDAMVRLAGSLEHVPVARKVEVGGWLLERLRKPKENVQTWWAVGRLGAREPFYGSAHNVVPAGVAAQWLERLLTIDWKKVQPAAFAATLIARMSGDRERDIDATLRTRVTAKLLSAKAPSAWCTMVREVVELDEAEERLVFGESLPPGLKLVA
jgi:molecular chaperone DnaK (HSP70)